MAEIHPFRGVHYNQSIIGDLATVICPPYDIITPQFQDELYHRSEYNFVRLEHGREFPQDNNSDNKYTRSAATLEQWLAQGILETDNEPALYLHDQHFIYQGKQYQRRGITTLVRLEEWDRMVVRPHEGTFAAPKSDRLSLLWACQANISPIMTLFTDEGQQVAALLAVQEKAPPVLDASTNEESNRIWAITEPEIVAAICRHLADQSLYIADGHHRYESALLYRDERRACADAVSGDEAYNFVMMTLVDIADPGLVILPPHRLVRGVPRNILDSLVDSLRVFFEMEILPVSELESLARRENLLVAGLLEEQLVGLALKESAEVDRMMPYFHTELYKKLAVSIVDHVILEHLLGLDSEKQKAAINYTYDLQDALQRVSDEEYQLAFLLSPVKPEIFKAIADAGDRMPRKSTYFYPKLPAGLILNRLV